MRLGLVTGEYPPTPGGVGDFSRQLSLALASIGHTVHVITRSSPPHEDGAVDGLTVHRRIRSWGAGSLTAIRRLARELALDILNIQYQAAAYGMSPPIHFLPAAAGLPSAITFHDLRVPYLFPKAGALRWQTILYFARSAAGVVVTNPEDRLTLERAGGVRAMREIPIGSNITPAPPPNYSRSRWRAARGAADSDLLVGYFGFLNASKGGETLFRALAQIPHAKLILIGGREGASDPTNAAYASQLDRLAAELGISQRLIRTGYLPPAETTAALLACDVMAMPYADGASFRRGTFMAALAHGRPTVTTRPAVELPQLRDRENILLVPPRHPDALADAIRALWADAPLRARLAAGAAALADAFTWDKIAAQTAEFFSSLRPYGT